MKRFGIIIAAVVLVFTTCTAYGQVMDGEDMVRSYTQISQEEAQNMMDTEDDYIILDVRREDEFESGHIPGAICIPNESIGTEQPEELPDKDQIILIYCRSGNRSKQAAEKLFHMGYTNIYEFGGINTWAGEVVTGPAEEPDMAVGIKINDTDIPVTWEHNGSVEALKQLAEKESLTIQMSMYGGFEQVGPIGQELPSDDQQTTTQPGDIVLYSGDQIVIFYGSNFWAYTKLGHADLTEEELQGLLGNEDVTLTIYHKADGKGALKTIQERGVLRVGTAGDYMPMSYLDPETGAYVGFDAELAEDLAASLDVEVEYVETSWPTLMDDTLAGKFDLAICGITVTDARKEQALMSEGYLENGKTVLCRAEDAQKYTSLEAINHPEVRVMENPGGLNEKFARENLPDATLIIHDVNQEIPGLVASGEADVMITETMEAGYYVGQDSRLAAPLIYEPFTNGQLGVLMPKGSEDLLDYVNNFLEEEKANGRINELAEEYIYQYIEEQEQAA